MISCSSKSCSSGIRIRSAPLAIPHHKARYPASRPITSMMLHLHETSKYHVLIDRFHRRIYSSIKSDRVICAGNIKIDRSRNADRIYAEVRKFLSSGKRTVSSDNYKSVDTVFLQIAAAFCCPSSVRIDLQRAV